MLPSPNAVAFVKRFEKCRLQAYFATQNEQDRNIVSIGWGTTGRDIHLGMSWTQQECDDRFTADAAVFAKAITNLLTHETSQAQFDALFALAYNIGIHNFATSTLLELHNAGNFEAAAAEFIKWDHQAGKVLVGLLTRCEAEEDMYRCL